MDIYDFKNLEAWAITQGYDPEKNYVTTPELPEGMLSPHFHEDEFRSNGDGTLGPNGISTDLLTALELIRSKYGDVPVHINSGYRDPAYNKSIGGAPNSRHMHGDAADFRVEGVDPAKVYADLDPLHLTGGLGKYDTFTHIDFRGYKARW